MEVLLSVALYPFIGEKMRGRTHILAVLFPSEIFHCDMRERVKKKNRWWVAHIFAGLFSSEIFHCYLRDEEKKVVGRPAEGPIASSPSLGHSPETVPIISVRQAAVPMRSL